jgi:hypothetical protein
MCFYGLIWVILPFYLFSNYHCNRLTPSLSNVIVKTCSLILIFRVKEVNTGDIQVAVWISVTPDLLPTGGDFRPKLQQPSNGQTEGHTSSVEENITASTTNCLWYVVIDVLCEGYFKIYNAVTIG